MNNYLMTLTQEVLVFFRTSADAVTYAYAINIANNISNFDLVEIIEKVMMNYA